MTEQQKSEYTVQSLLDTAYDYYKSYYDDPRSVSYFSLSDELDTSSLPVMDYVAEALDLGCRDAQNDKERRTKDELVDVIGHPSDEHWNIVAEQ